MAAISSTLWTLLQAGDQVVIDHTLYGNSFTLFLRGLPRFGVKVVVADFTDLDAVETAIGLGAPKLVFFESPANPNLRVIDSRDCRKVVSPMGAHHYARQHDGLLDVDGTGVVGESGDGELVLCKSMSTRANVRSGVRIAIRLGSELINPSSLTIR